MSICEVINPPVIETSRRHLLFNALCGLALGAPARAKAGKGRCVVICEASGPVRAPAYGDADDLGKLDVQEMAHV